MNAPEVPGGAVNTASPATDDVEVDRLVREELQQVATSRTAMLLGGALAMIVFVFVDRALVGRWIAALVISRLSFAVLIVAIAFGIRRRALPVQRALLAIAALAVTATVVVLVANTGGIHSPFLIALALVPFGISLVLPGDMTLATATSVGTLVAGLGIYLAEGETALAGTWLGMSVVIGAMTLFFAREEGARQRDRQRLLLEQRRHLEEIRTSQGRLRAAFEISPDPITLIDLSDLRYVSANPAFCALTGWSEHELVGRTADELGIFRLVDQKATIDARLAAGGALGSEACITTRDGRVRHIRNFAQRLTLGGRPCMLSFSRDETDARAAEEARAAMQAELEHVHARLRRVVDNAPLVLFALDADGTFTLSDGKGLARMGELPGAIVGKQPAEVWADAPELVAACAQGLKGDPCVVTARHARVDQVWQLWWAPVKQRNGSLERVVCVGLEVTDRVVAEESLRASETSFRQLINGLPDVVMVETDGRIVYVNDAGRKLLGYSDAALHARRLADLLHPDSPGRHGDHDTRRAPAPEHPVEQRWVRADGSEQWVEATGLHALFAGRPSCICIARDTSMRRTMEERLRVSDRMASVGTLAAGVAHEINNPLTYIIANLDHARAQVARLRALGGTSELLDELDAGLHDADSGVLRVRNIVRDLKTFSHPDESALTDLDLHAVIESSISMSWNQLRHRARLERSFATDVPRVRGNHARLGQVVLNLLVNAAQAMPEGESNRHCIRVATRLEPQSEVVVLEVADDGCGISPDDLKRIFDPFFTTKEVGVGTGLGLSICLGIVRAMGGEIRADSVQGRGSTFTVRLPVAAAAVAAPQAAEQDAHADERQGVVWVVDDDPMVLRSLRRQLSAAHDVRTFDAAPAVLEAVEQGMRFDVLLCDLMMPVMTGMQLYEAVQQRAPELAERIVFLTGGAFSPAAVNFVSQRRHLEKPIDGRTLRAFTRAFVQGERTV
ncbi:MAG: PAS domain S-box protein [Deltaproteobacteria bacterium]|nr:PAS domain S-box protein [Deltaproteobacteria bacterium]